MYLKETGWEGGGVCGNRLSEKVLRNLLNSLKNYKRLKDCASS